MDSIEHFNSCLGTRVWSGPRYMGSLLDLYIPMGTLRIDKAAFYDKGWIPTFKPCLILLPLSYSWLFFSVRSVSWWLKKVFFVMLTNAVTYPKLFVFSHRRHHGPIMCRTIFKIQIIVALGHTIIILPGAFEINPERLQNNVSVCKGFTTNCNRASSGGQQCAHMMKISIARP